MTLLAVAVVLSLIAAGWTVHPLIARRTAVVRDSTSSELLDAEANRRAALSALRDAEYDFIAGKLDADDYAALRERIGREALAAMRATGRASDPAAPAPSALIHACGFVNPPASRFCAGCGVRLP